MTATLTLVTSSDADWRDDAECAGYPTDWWFPDKTDGAHCYTRARTVCAMCTVRSDCLEHALSAPEVRGMWGGRTPVELSRERGRRAREARRGS